MLTIALSKGRILEQTLPLLEKAGLSISEKELQSRKRVDTPICTGPCKNKREYRLLHHGT